MKEGIYFLYLKYLNKFIYYTNMIIIFFLICSNFFYKANIEKKGEITVILMIIITLSTVFWLWMWSCRNEFGKKYVALSLSKMKKMISLFGSECREEEKEITLEKLLELLGKKELIRVEIIISSGRKYEIHNLFSNEEYEVIQMKNGKHLKIGIVSYKEFLDLVAVEIKKNEL